MDAMGTEAKNYPGMVMAAVKRLKAKLIKLYSARLSRGTVELHTPERVEVGRISLYQLIKRRTRRDASNK